MAFFVSKSYVAVSAKSSCLASRVGPHDANADAVAEGEDTSRTFAPETVVLFVESVVVVRQVAQRHHPFDLRVVQFDVDSPLRDARDVPVELLVELVEHELYHFCT